MLRHIDTCLPDYFNGSVNHVFAVPVDNSTTAQDIRDGILYEYDITMGGPEIPSIDKLVNELTKDCQEGKPLFPDLEPVNDYCDLVVYAFFDYVPEK